MWSSVWCRCIPLEVGKGEEEGVSKMMDGEEGYGRRISRF